MHLASPAGAEDLRVVMRIQNPFAPGGLTQQSLRRYYSSKPNYLPTIGDLQVSKISSYSSNLNFACRDNHLRLLFHRLTKSQKINLYRQKMVFKYNLKKNIC
jgi:hypothetical protein